MVRLSDLPDTDARHLREKECPPFDSEPWVTGPPLAERRVAIVTSAGLHRRDDRSFDMQDTGYRVIDGALSAGELVMTHSSTNFDRTGFQQDLNVCFPLQRLHEMAADGTIGSVANFHYTVSGAPHPKDLEESARAIAKSMKADGVDTVLLVPI